MITDKAKKDHQKLPYSKILGVRVNLISLKKAVSQVEKWLKTDKQYQIVTPNPEQVVLAQKDLSFKKVLNQANLAIPDGIGLVWAVKAQASNFSTKVERVSGVDLMTALCRLARRFGGRIFLLGGRDAAEKVAKKLKTKFPNLEITSHSGAKNIEQESLRERQEIVKKINNFEPHLLFVAYGAPHQEVWIAANLPLLKVKVAMGVGGAFDYISGKVPRAPEFIRNIGLEWFFRLLSQPRRIKRHLTLVKFIRLVMVKNQVKKGKIVV